MRATLVDRWFERKASHGAINFNLEVGVSAYD